MVFVTFALVLAMLVIPPLLMFVSTANEMQRTMKNIFSDYVEFLVTSTDPSAKIAREANRSAAMISSPTQATTPRAFATSSGNSASARR